jgi:hypothetical protein
MNFKDAFPEIDDFFQKDYFSESDLNDLIIRLTSNYFNENLSKAKSILELKLIGYKLQNEENIALEKNHINLNNDLTKSKKQLRKEKKKLEKAKRLDKIKKAVNDYKKSLLETNQNISKKLNTKEKNKQKLNSNNSLKEFNESFINPKKPTFKKATENKNYDVEKLAYELNWSFKFFQTLIAQKTGKKDAKSLTEKEFVQCNDMIESRKKGLKRKEKQNYKFPNVIKSKRHSHNRKKNGVWDKISLYGPGKIIYIRSK